VWPAGGAAGTANDLIVLLSPDLCPTSTKTGAQFQCSERHTGHKAVVGGSKAVERGGDEDSTSDRQGPVARYIERLESG